MFRALAVLVVCSGCVHATRAAREPGQGEPTLRVTTYNLNFGLAGEPATLAAIGAGDADVILLQETNEAWERAIRREYGGRYAMGFHHCCGAGGLALLVRGAADAKVQVIPSQNGWFPAIRAVVPTPIGDVQILSVHLHPPVSETGSFVSGYLTTGGTRGAELRGFVEHLKPGLPTLIVGDFNESNGEALTLLRARGFVDAAEEYVPHKTTWRWPLAVGQLSSRLDHVFYSPELEPLSCDVLEQGESDHLPVTGVFTSSL